MTTKGYHGYHGMLNLSQLFLSLQCARRQLDESTPHARDEIIYLIKFRRLGNNILPGFRLSLEIRTAKEISLCPISYVCT